MRTKVLLSTIAVLAWGLASSNAQVYSANVVGYINLQLTNGFNLIGNQLDLDGTGTNNTLVTCFGTQMPNGTKVYPWDGGLLPSCLYNSTANKWAGSTNVANAALSPGQGVFVQVPAAAVTPLTVTLVGNVLQGSLSNNITVGYQIVSSMVPLSGLIDTNLGYAPSKGDKVYTWVVASQQPSSSSLYSGTKWGGAGDPNLAIG